MPDYGDLLGEEETTSEYKLHGHIGTWHMEHLQYTDYSAMRGPCDEGYHVPLNTERQAVYNIWTALGGGSSDGTNFGIALKLPFAGFRYYSNANVYNVESYGFYWSSTPGNANLAYHLSFSSSGISPQNNNLRADGFSVRCFKDEPVIPTPAEEVAGPVSTGTISPSTSGPTLSLWTATEDCVCTISGTLRGSNSDGVTYADLYKNGTYVTGTSSGFISGTKDFEMQVSVVSGDVLTLQTSRGSGGSGSVNDVYVLEKDWTTLYDGSFTATGAGIFWNSADGLISLSSNGTTWITIADKNLGATTVWNSGDTLSEANCGKYFQRGNNYMFPGPNSSETIAKSATQVNVTGYGPGNYYSSSTWITTNPRQDSTSDGNNLRGGVTGPVAVDKYVPRA